MKRKHLLAMLILLGGCGHKNLDEVSVMKTPVIIIAKCSDCPHPYVIVRDSSGEVRIIGDSAIASLPIGDTIK